MDLPAQPSTASLLALVGEHWRCLRDLERDLMQRIVNSADARSVMRICLANLVLAVLCLSPPAQSATITDPLQGPVTLPPGIPAAGELSGIAYAGAGLYFAISDSGAELYLLEAVHDIHIRSISLESAIRARRPHDVIAAVFRRLKAEIDLAKEDAKTFPPIERQLKHIERAQQLVTEIGQYF